jgi:acetylornithine deacetylase
MAIARTAPDLREMIRALIACPSVSSLDSRFDQSNRDVVELLADWLDTLGFDVEIQSIAGGKANLLAAIGPREKGDGLVFAGHTDTVPCDPECWHSNPFEAVERDGRIYGLGSADMKSFFALALAAVRRYDPKSFRQPLLIVATADEESSMAGAKSFLPQDLRPARRCVIGEPTGLRPVRAHKGVMMERIRVRGRSGHASDPSLGANAIEAMHAILSELLRLRDELREKYRDPAFAVPFPTLNLGAIHGGDNPNRICGRCELSIDIRLLPGMQIDALRELLRTRLEPVLPPDAGFALAVESLFDGVPAFATPPETELIRCCERLTGSTSGAVSFGTEAPFFSRLGLETVILGAGHIEQAHQPDEFLPVAHIDPATRILRGLIERYCLTPHPA